MIVISNFHLVFLITLSIILSLRESVLIRTRNIDGLVNLELFCVWTVLQLALLVVQRETRLSIVAFVSRIPETGVIRSDRKKCGVYWKKKCIQIVFHQVVSGSDLPYPIPARSFFAALRPSLLSPRCPILLPSIIDPPAPAVSWR